MPSTQSDIQFKPANIKDLRGLYRLEHTCFELDAWPLLDLVAVLTWPGIVRLKAVCGSQMVAFIAGDVKPQEGVGWITTIGVLPQYRRMHIASQLLQICETQMAMPRVRLSVRRSNIGAIAMYIRHGYTQVNTWPAYYNGGEDALILEKRR